MTVQCPPGCGHDGPPPGAFALYDALDLCAVAVDEAGSGRLPEAMSAWRAARDAASAFAGLHRDLPAVTHALGLVLAAAGPSDADAPWRPDLWHALNTAALALCLAADGDNAAAGDLLLDACGHADGLPCSPPLRVVLAAAWDQAREQVAA
jgi:hypothetical protein